MGAELPRQLAGGFPSGEGKSVIQRWELIAPLAPGICFKLTAEYMGMGPFCFMYPRGVQLSSHSFVKKEKPPDLALPMWLKPRSNLPF